jgi:hypothetical protein
LAPGGVHQTPLNVNMSHVPTKEEHAGVEVAREELVSELPGDGNGYVDLGLGLGLTARYSAVGVGVGVRSCSDRGGGDRPRAETSSPREGRG